MITDLLSQGWIREEPTYFLEGGSITLEVDFKSIISDVKGILNKMKESEEVIVGS